MKDAGLLALLVSVRHRFYLFICAFAAMLFFGEVDKKMRAIFEKSRGKCEKVQKILF